MKYLSIIFSFLLLFSCSTNETNVAPEESKTKVFFDGKLVKSSFLEKVEKHNQSAVFENSEFYFSSQEKMNSWVSTLNENLQKDYFNKMSQAESLRDASQRMGVEKIYKETGIIPNEFQQLMDEFSFKNSEENPKSLRVPAQYVTIYDGTYFTGQSKGIVITPSIGGGMKNRAESCKITSSGGATIFWDRTWWRGDSKVYFAFPYYEDPTMVFANRAESVN